MGSDSAMHYQHFKARESMVTALPQISDESLFTTAQVAQLLQCHRNSILNWQKNGLLKPRFHQRGKKVFAGKDIKSFFFNIF